MIDKKLIPVGGLKKEPFSGGHHGMRYFFRSDESKETFSKKESWTAAEKNRMHIVNAK